MNLIILYVYLVLTQIEEEFYMTTINKLEQALAGSEGLASQLKTFALDTDDKQAKQMFNQLATTMENTAQSIKSRVDYVKSEEPQYNQPQ